MDVNRRNVLKTGVAVAAAANYDWLTVPVVSAAETSRLDSLVRVMSSSHADFAAALAGSFASLGAHPVVKTLLPTTFLVTNVSNSTINSLGADLWVDSGDDQYCVPKILQTRTGDASTHAGRRAVLPLNSSLLVTPFFAVTQHMASKGAITLKPELLNGSTETRFLLKRLASASRVSLSVRGAVVNGTEFVGAYKHLKLHARVVQAAEHDMANKVRYRVNAGASPSSVAVGLRAFMEKYAFTTAQVAGNRRTYIKASLAYAKVLLQVLEQDPVSFLRDIKVTTLQRRVNFTFVHGSVGEAK